MVTSLVRRQLAVFGGHRAVRSDPGDLFAWPIVTSEDEAAVLDVLRRGAMSGLDVTTQFEHDYAAWQGARHALGLNTGTAAIQSAMYGCRVGVGDEVLCQSATYWASALPCYSLGATPVFVELDPHTLCIDPGDIEHRITARARAIVVVHYAGHPAEMDPVMEIARRRGLKVIEDVSHAHGGVYKGKKVGTFGDVAAMSLMSGKALAVGEAGMLTTDDTEIYERALAFGHYERYDADLQTSYLRASAGLPLGGHKYRMHQMSAAVGRVQLRQYDGRMAEIQEAMNHFWDLLEGTPGLRAHRVPNGSGSTMGGWYSPRGLYRPEELGGLSVSRFAHAVEAEGAPCRPGMNAPLHLHPLFNTVDVYGHGQATRIAHTDRDVRQPEGTLPRSEAICARVLGVPWFKHHRPALIRQFADAYRKVAESHQALLESDPGNRVRSSDLGSWGLFGQGTAT